MLTRLWILEETTLSNTIQLTSTRFALKFQELAKAWAGAYLPWQSTPKSAVEADSTAFIRGYFENGTIRRSGVNIRLLHPFPETHTFYSHIFSTRRTMGFYSCNHAAV